MNKDAQFKILLVAENPRDARLVEVFLDESDLHNSQIVNKKTLEGAINTLHEATFNVVILGLNLLDNKGFDTLEKMMAAHPQANVVVFTGIEEDLSIRALQAGAQDYIVKGNFGSEYLAKTLSYAIERNRRNMLLETTI